MAIKQAKAVEIESDLYETKKKTTQSKKRKRVTTEEKGEEDDDGTPLRGIFCLKTRQDMKIFEEKEDCFILDFDPNDSFDARKISFSDDPRGDNDDVSIIHEKGQVACRDFPHPRHHCSKYPFGSTRHATHCKQCYCYVCDLAAPCAEWTSHCKASDNIHWKPLRDFYKKLTARHATINK